MMEWRKLLSTRRLGEAGRDPLSPARDPFQKDFDRIVFSSAFRRLQDKTQVHSLPESDYVRTRLTHSLEVASVGRSLGTTVGQHIDQRGAAPTGITAAEFGHIVAAAGLAHDIGNPPFGHFGEATIRAWFQDDPLGRRLIADLPIAQQSDLLGFEGNAQGFRLLARLQHRRDYGGLRLTFATLGAYTKYPRAAHLGDRAVVAGDVGASKFGFFQAEDALFDAVAHEVGLLRGGGPAEPYWCRHPLAFLVEAADDICYHIVDLEDGFKLGRITFEEAEHHLVRLAGERGNRSEGLISGARKIADLRAKAIGQLVDQAAAAFLDRIQQILDGSYRGELLAETSAQPVLAEIMALVEKRLFETAERYENEISGAKAITTMLASFAGAFFELEQAVTGGPAAPAADALLAELFPKIDFPLTDRYRWLLAITDYVSGMTDSYALSQYQKLKTRA